LPQPVKQLATNALVLLRENPRHPSLHFKKVGRFWSAEHSAAANALGAKEFPHRTDDDGSYRKRKNRADSFPEMARDSVIAKQETGSFQNRIGGRAFEAEDQSPEKERTFHQSPSVTTRKLEAGYMHHAFL
jgi:hypothetical protein